MDYARNELTHYGILGMKWGKRKSTNAFKPTGIRAALAKRANDKVDNSFKDWEQNSQKKKNAISSGKRLNSAKRAFEEDKGNKLKRKAYSEAKKEYSKALKENTLFRQGAVRQEVGQDLSRKYLKDAKQLKRSMSSSSDKNLDKHYNYLMSKHAVEREKARRAPEVGAKRSAAVANLRRARTMAIKTAATSAVIAVGVVGTNAVLKKYGKTGITADNVSNVIKKGKAILKATGYIY